MVFLWPNLPFHYGSEGSNDGSNRSPQWPLISPSQLFYDDPEGVRARERALGPSPPRVARVLRPPPGCVLGKVRNMTCVHCGWGVVIGLRACESPLFRVSGFGFTRSGWERWHGPVQVRSRSRAVYTCAQVLSRGPEAGYNVAVQAFDALCPAHHCPMPGN